MAGKWTPILWKGCLPGLMATNEEGILDMAPSIAYPVLNDKLWARKAAVEIIVKDYAGWW